MENQNEALKSMYLSTIPNIKKKFTSSRSPLDVSDIQGAKSRYIQHPLPQRDNPIHSHEIQKSRPKQIIPEVVNKPSFSLQVDDIQGTRSKMNKFVTTRHTNPLDPQYQSPKVQYAPVESPKFIRDGMKIDDIEGVRSRETFAIKLERAGKTINTKSQIVSKIKPTPKGFTRTTTNINFSLNAQDINKGDDFYANMPKRSTNPLQPRYNIAGEKQYGQIIGSKHVIKNNGLPLRPSNSLMTNDIEGAKTKINNFVIQKKQEIPNSKPQTLKRGISSNRKTNPLQPNYNYTGWTENVTTKYQSFTRPKTAHQRFDAFIK